MRTSLVSSIPRATIARESPTSTISMPAWSATCAEGKSWAVMTVMGSFLRYSDISVGSVTFLRAGDDELPSGECDDWRIHWIGWSSLAGAAGRRIGRAIGRIERNTLPVIDIIAALGIVVDSSDGEVGSTTINERNKIKTKKRSQSNEWSDSSSPRHPFLISNWHTGIFMRGRENISVCLNNLGPIFFRPLSLPRSQQIAQPRPRLFSPPAEAWPAINSV
jgi:hypothetical protein